MALQGEPTGVAAPATAGGPLLLLGRDLARWRPPYAWVVTALWIAAIGSRAWALGSPSVEYDEGVYWASLRAEALGHPLFTSIFSSQPPLFLNSIYPLYLFFGQTFEAARAAVILYSLVGLAAVWLTAWALCGRWSGALALALLAFVPRYLTESYTLQAEAPALAFATVSVALAVHAVRQSRVRWRGWLAAGSGAALMLGVAVKLFDVVAVVPVALYLLAPAGLALVDATGKPRWPGRAALGSALGVAMPDLARAAGGAVLAAALVLLPFAGRWPALYDQVIQFHLAAGRITQQSLLDRVGVVVGSGGDLPLLALAVALAAWALARRWWRVLPLTAWFVGSLLLLLAQRPLLGHHLALLLPPAALIAAVVVLRAFGERTSGALPGASPRDVVKYGSLGAALLVAALGLSVGLNGVRHAALARDHDSLPAFVLAAATLPDDLVVTDDQYVAGLADRDVPPDLVDTSFVRVQAGYLSAQQLEREADSSRVRAVLFYSGRFDRVPGFRAWIANNPRFVLVRTFGPGKWLYIKLPKGAPQPA
jgi:4-amino-4-deoxy-L-arabinose transferase-like glycosyltransferase